VFFSYFGLDVTYLFIGHTSMNYVGGLKLWGKLCSNKKIAREKHPQKEFEAGSYQKISFITVTEKTHIREKEKKNVG